jgi:periplasmic protein TonB
METSTILTADILDILFDGRNKEYGAYDLRRTYRRRLTVSISVMLSVIFMLFIGFAFAGKNKELPSDAVKAKVIELATIKPPVQPVETPPPPPPAIKPPAPPAQFKTTIFVAPKIVNDDLVTKDEMPPVDALTDVKIGDKNVPDGLGDDLTVVAPPGDGDGKVIEQPTREEEDWKKTFTKVEIESDYPGGPRAWQRFLRNNLRFPDEAAEVGVEGFVVVQFIVDVEGNVSDVVAVSGPKELQAEAIRVIKKSGKWTPAIQNGHKVKSYKKQPLGFKLGAE